jgi:hypothetical protein
MKNLMKLMYAGTSGGSQTGGVNPSRVIEFLSRRFDVVVENLGTEWQRQIRCIDIDGRVRMRVLYSWDSRTGKWYYQPLPGRARPSRNLPASGDVVYRADGSYYTVWRAA